MIAASNNSTKCGLFICKPPKPYCDGISCYSTCPDFTVAKGNRCIYVSDCNKLGWVAYQRKCIPSCPPGTKFYAKAITGNDQCYSTCPYFTITQGNKCIDVSECKKLGWVVYHSNCFPSCPPGTKYTTDNDIYGNQCTDLLAGKLTLGASVILLAVVLLLCAILVRNPRRRKRVIPSRQNYQSQEPRQTLMIDNNQTSVSKVWGRQDGLNQDQGQTYAKRFDDEMRSVVDYEDTEVKNIGYWTDDDSQENCSDCRADNTYLSRYYDREHNQYDNDAYGNTYRRGNDYYGDNDNLSSVPTVVALRGFQDDDSPTLSLSVQTDDTTARKWQGRSRIERDPLVTGFVPQENGLNSLS